MREGWKKEKFEDVFDLQMGKTPSRDNPSYWDGTNTWVSISDMKDKKYISKSKEQISDIAVKDSGIKQVKKGTAIMSFKLSIGKTAIAEEDLFTNEAIMAFNVRDGYGITPDYIYYYLRGYKWDGANKAVMGATLNKKTIASNYFSYPSLPEQERIVAELDCLSDIIEKQKQQLKELDNLAQAIFYDMFGDPITNEKGWKVKPLGDACGFQQGEQVPIEEQFEVYKEGMVRFLRIVDFTQGNEKPRYVMCKNTKHILQNEQVAIVRYGTPGFVCFGKSGLIANNLFKIIPKSEDIAFRFLVYWLYSDAFQSVIKDNQYGVALQAIKFSTIKDINLIIPPINLQQEFASKIEAIEKQKELIKQSLSETETLFNSRMDYYFN